MKRILWTILHKSYTKIGKHFVFMMSPDKAHSTMISLMLFLGRFRFMRALVKAIFVKNYGDRLKQKVFGMDIITPVGLSAGFDKNGEILPMLSGLGFGFMTAGSVTAYKCDGNPRPWYYRLPASQSLVVNAGLPNVGSAKIIERIGKHSVRDLNNLPVVLSIAKTNSQKAVDTKAAIKDYVTSAIRAQKESNIKMIELNISCPNAYGGEPFNTPERLDSLLKAIRNSGITKPITIKMPVDLDWPHFKKLLDVAVKYDIDGVTISNLFKDRKKADLKDELPDSVKGNLSGRPTWEKSNYLIEKTYLEYGNKLTIIGVGGIFSAQDAYEKIKKGATVVEVISGLIYEGPQLPSEINYDLCRLLQYDGYENISQAIGAEAGKTK